MITTEITIVIISIHIIQLFVLLRKKTICITAGKMKVVSTSVKFPIRARMAWKEGTNSATTDMAQISTIRRTMILLVLMKSLPRSISSFSTVSLIGSIQRGKPPATVMNIMILRILPNLKEEGIDIMIFPCTPFSMHKIMTMKMIVNNDGQ